MKFWLAILFFPFLAYAESPCADFVLRDVDPEIQAYLEQKPNPHIKTRNPGQLRIAMPKGRFGGTGGISTQIRLFQQPVARACLAYELFLPADFTFMRGGKLPGLYGGPAAMIQSTASGCEDQEERIGWTMRLMWRRNGDGEAYGYVDRPHDRCGTSLGRGNWIFPRQQWVQLYIITDMNQQNQEGRLTVYVDGRKVIDETGVTYLDPTDNGVHGVFLSVFFGGNDRAWAPVTDQYLDIRNIRIGSDDRGYE